MLIFGCKISLKVMGTDKHMGKWWGRGEAKIRRKEVGRGRERRRHTHTHTDTFDSAILLVEINTTDHLAQIQNNYIQKDTPYSTVWNIKELETTMG